ncbi:transcriptional regulator [Leptospira perolatii]|uniref:Transcriptional regulator n=1 Tax=Leptospira perolatii TaxID=2023191 RepID=A0A2M9ZPK1_9LEPT|nr:FecR family protein [Leptospira perolatii]PJZ70689.1 transcriptional regulator [Leptospira perolatii]PJZ73899.1 transcriptional regulator [Leptospira perolatii]
MDKDLEKKIQDALEGKANDLTPTVDVLGSLLAKPWVELDSGVKASQFEKLFSDAQVDSKSKLLSFRSPYLYWVAAAAAVILVFPVYFLMKEKAPVLEPSGIVIQEIQGRAFLSSSDSSHKVALNLGESVALGQSVSTDADSVLRISVSKGIGLLLSPNTDLEIVKEGKDSFRLKNGNLLVHLHKNLKKEEFQILTEMGKIEVRGTKFSVSANPESGVEVSVLEGRVAVLKEGETDKGEQVLEPGQKIKLGSKGFQRSFLRDQELQDLSGKFERLPVEEIPRNKDRSFVSKDELFKEYQRLERVVLTDKTVQDGVIIDMDEQFMYLQTLDKEIQIPREMVQEVIQVR